MNSTLKEKKLSSLTSQQKAEEDIVKDVVQWVQDHNAKAGENKKIQSYGQIYFAENGRTSWFIRYPFDPPNKKETTSERKTEHSTTEVTSFNSDNDGTNTHRPSRLPQISGAVSSRSTGQGPNGATDEASGGKTTASNIVEFIRKTWEIPSPQLIISITGGAAFFKLLSPQMRNTFEKSLVSAAVNSDAWVFTGGTHSGVMKEVGSIFEKWAYKNDKAHTRVPVIGIASWNYTTDREQLDQISIPTSNYTSVHMHGRTESRASSANFARPRHFEKLYRNQLLAKRDSESCSIDPNHTHFILLDDCCAKEETFKKTYEGQTRTGIILPLRADIEQKLQTYNYSEEDYRIPMAQIPLVQILIDGGSTSMATVKETIEHGTPVVVIQGTGRAADLIADICDAIRFPKDKGDTPTIDTSKLKELLEKDVYSTILPPGKQDEYLEIFKSKKYRRLITICPLLYRPQDTTSTTSPTRPSRDSGQKSLDSVILEALLKATGWAMEDLTKVRLQKFKLAMMWRKYDDIKDYLLKDQKDNPWTEKQLDCALGESLYYDAKFCIQLLVGQGASFDRLRHYINIGSWYEKMRAEKSLLFKTLSSDGTNLQHELYRKYLKKNALEITEASQGQQSSFSNIGILDAGGLYFDRGPFNDNDASRQSGYVSKVTIGFSKDPNPVQLTFFVLSPAQEDNSFQIIRHYRITDQNQITSKRNSKRSYDIEVNLPSSMLYLDAEQFLAIDFDKPSTHVSTVPGSKSRSIPLKKLDDKHDKNKSVTSNEHLSNHIALSFHLVPTQNFIRDIFLWSVFSDRYEQAVCLCSYSPHSTIAALLASKVYEKAAKLTSDTEKMNDYLKKSQGFDKHAAGIIDECFRQNEDFALQTLTTKSKLYFDYSPLDLVMDTNNRSFLASKCVQEHLDNLWYGELNERRGRKFHIDLLIFILCICPFLAIFSCIDEIFTAPHPRETASMAWYRRLWRRLCRFRGRGAVRFYFSIIFYILFLALFSFVVLVDYFPLNNNNGKRNGFNIGIPVTEIILHLCIWSLIIEECVELIHHVLSKKAEETNDLSDALPTCLCGTSPTYSCHILSTYLSETKWNILDSITILVYFIAFISRFFVIENAFIVSKVAMCIDLFLWYVRTLHFFAASRRLGPKLLMIFETMKDLTFFICFILIFLIAYSVSSYALITTEAQVVWIPTDDNSPSRTYSLLQNGQGLWTWTLLRNVLDWGMWKVYGQVELIDHNQVGNVTSVTADNNTYGNTAFVLTIIFVCVANVLLLNVLVALFNVTFDKVEKDSYRAWAYHRFVLIKEYAHKSPFPPPFTILYYGYKLGEWIYHNQSSRRSKMIGSLHSRRQVDARIRDFIVFNGTDFIHHSGTIKKISINFCEPPKSNASEIHVYIIQRKENHPTEFFIRHPPIAISPSKMSAGKQTIKCSIQVEGRSYLGFSFDDNAGSPFVTDSDSYFVKKSLYPNDIEEMKKHSDKQQLDFSFEHCNGQGIAVKFIVQDSYLNIAKKAMPKCCQPNTAKRDNGVPMFKSLSERLHPTEMHPYRMTEFHKRDNMLRESSIAETYWRDEMKRIIKQERKEKKGKVYEEKTLIDPPEVL